MRGVEQRLWLGSIPACAGEPVILEGAYLPTRVHPRVCGGALRRVHLGGLVMGPSPRVRGSHTAISPWRAPWGSIPACAGEPHPSTIEGQP